MHFIKRYRTLPMAEAVGYGRTVRGWWLTLAVAVAAVAAGVWAASELGEFRWPIVAGVGVVIALAAIGFHLLPLGSNIGETWSRLGTGLVVGVIVAATIGVVQLSIQRDTQRDMQNEQFRLTLSLQRDLEGFDLHGRDLHRIHLVGKNLRNADLEHADLTNAILIRSDFGGQDAELERVILNHTTLFRAKFRWAHMANAELASANGPRADFSHADLGGADLTQANLDLATLNDANLEDATLRTTTFRDAKLIGMHAYNTEFRKVVLNRARLNRADLSGSCFIATDLTQADLRNAILLGTDLSRADLGVNPPAIRADLRGAIYDSATKWPPGVSPAKLGAIRQSGEFKGRHPCPRSE
ncbi:MAG: hypothetical protein QOJ97_221 [Solirubrobacteraceae bacterium]|jgi:uncharacterized protein YjbI with pentapeptide repeats|nr:hypothetical protein [Solirubrobacteraceae bacterium]